MCGIVGYISTVAKFNLQVKEQFMREALIFDTVRGEDSTGVIALYDNFDSTCIKSTQPGTHFVNSKNYLSLPNDAWAMIGHNRAATKGNVSRRNAHPFIQGHVALVHNGTLWNHGNNLPHKDKKFDVDSEVIAYNLSQAKPEDAADILSKIDGSFALVWIDTRDSSINFCRNNNRPMHIGANKANNTMFFMSDGRMLSTIGHRLKHNGAGSYINGIYSLKTYQLLKFKEGKLVPEVITVAPFVDRPYVVTSHHGYGRSGNNYHAQKMKEFWKPNQNSGTTGSGILTPNQYGHSGQIEIDGQLRTIPEVMVDFLKDNSELDPSFLVKFNPEKFVHWGKGHEWGQMVGEIESPAWQGVQLEAVVNNVPKHIAEKMIDQPWTVIPVGLSFSSIDLKDTLCIICKVRSYIEREDLISSSHKEEEEKDDHLCGPHGVKITEAAFLMLVKHGCVMCQASISTLDHEELLWVGEMQNQPLCTGCCDYYTDPRNSSGQGTAYDPTKEGA